MAFKFFLLAALIATSLAVPLSSRNVEEWLEKEECPVSEAEQIQFAPQKTYVYSYKGKSQVILGNRRSKTESHVDWQAEVDLSWLSPCQVSISVKKPVVNGQSDEVLSELLVGRPMIATVKQGVVTKVLVDSKDQPASLNLKKGIVAAIQNVLPEMSPIIKNKTFVESDTLGNCPTRYSVEQDSASYIVYKQKNHTECKHQIKDPAQNLVTSVFMKLPVSPLLESYSECRQIIRKSDKIITSIHCKDENLISSVISSHIKAKQESKLTLIRVQQSANKPQLQQPWLTDLKFENIPEPKSQKIVPKVQELLKQLCSATENQLKEDAPTILAKLIGYLHRVPEEKLKGLLSEIKRSSYCSKPQRLESLFLDAIAFVDNAGAVEIMVQEIVNHKVSGGRTALYTVGLYLMRKPCIHSVEALQPLFRSQQTPSPTLLAASSLVHRYCSKNPQCLQESPVRAIYQTLAQQIDSHCRSSEQDQESKIKTLIALKAAGNLGNSTETLRRSIQQCIRSQEASVFVRIASAQSYRKVPCHKRPTEDLINIALEKSQNPEVRISAYVAAIPCASYEQAEKIVGHISEEHSTQVRSYILSHLKNIQSSDAPHLAGLRYNLTSLHIPSDYHQDIRKHSRNFDLSYYMPTIGLGGGMDTSLIYTRGSYLPRQLHTNLTANIYDEVINIGEFSLRVKDLEQLVELVFGPEGYLSGIELTKAIEEVLSTIQHKGLNIPEKLMEYVKNQMSDKKKASIHEILNMITSRQRSSKGIDVDAFARIFGDEVAFSSLFTQLQKISLEQLVYKVSSVIQQIIVEAATSRANSARALQMNLEFNIPTSQGIPLHSKFVATLLSTWDMKNDVNVQRLKVDVEPSIAVDVNAFVGYSFGVKTGLRSKTRVALKPQSKVIAKVLEQKIEMVYDIPAKLKAVDIKVNNYMMIKMPSKTDQQLSAHMPSQRAKHMCSEFVKSTLGLSVCAKVNYPSLWEIPILPLGEIEAYTELEKVNPGKELIKMEVRHQIMSEKKEVTIQLEAPGSRSPRKGEVGIEYRREGETRMLKSFIVTPWNQVRAIQVDLKNKLSSQALSTRFVAYYGHQRQLSSSDEVVVSNLRVGKRYKEIEGEFILKTKSRLARYITTDIELDGSVELSATSIPFPVSAELRKWEVKVGIPEVIELENFIRMSPMRRSQQQMEYEMLLQARTPRNNLIKLEGKAESSGSLYRQNYHSNIRVIGKLLESEIMAESKVVYNRQTKQLYYMIESPTQQRVYFMFNTELQQQNSNSYNAKAELKVPALIRPYRLSGNVEYQRPNYQLSLVAKKENEPILKIQGPVSLNMRPGEVRSKSEVKVTVPETSREYLVKSKLTLTPETKMAALTLKKASRLMFSVEAELERTSSEALISVLEVALPKVVEAKIRAEKNPSSVHFAVNGELRPNTPRKQKVKAQSQWNWQEQQVSALVAYDVERNPQKKLELSAHYDLDYHRKYASVKGEVNLEGKEYRYTTEATLGTLSSNPEHKRNEIRMKVQDPRGEEFLLEWQLEAQHSQRETSLIKKIVFKPFNEKPNRLDMSISYDIKRLPYQMEMKSEASVELPRLRLRKVNARLETMLDLRSLEQKFQYKLDISSPMLTSPLKAHLEIENNQRQLLAKTDVDLLSSIKARIYGQLEITKGQQLLINAVQGELNARLPPNKNYQLKVMKTSQTIRLTATSHGTKVLEIEQQQKGNNEWLLKVITPSQMTEGRAQVRSGSVSFSLYPNKHQSNNKYEAEGHYRRSSQEFSSGLKIRYPGSQKDYGFSTQFEHKPTISQGKVELDIFRNPNEKVLFSVRVKKEAMKSYQMEADIKVPGQNFQPRVEADLAWSPEVKGLELLAKKSPSEKPSFVLAAKASRTTHKNYILYAKLKTPSDKVEMVSNVHLHQLRYCHGGSINGTVHSRTYGSYDFASSVCAPAYVEFGVKKSYEHQMYMAKVGLRNYESVKVALDAVQNSHNWHSIDTALSAEPMITLYGRPHYRPKIPIVALGLELYSPYILSVQTHYNATGVNEYMRKIVYPAQRMVKKVAYEIEEQIPRAIKEELLPQMPDVSYIFNKLQYIEESMEMLKETVSQEVRKVMYKLEEVAYQLQEEYQQMHHQLHKVWRTVEIHVEKIFGFRPERVYRYLHQIRSRMLRSEHCSCEGRDCVAVKLKCLLREVKEIPVARQVIRMVEESTFWEWIIEQFEYWKYQIERVFHQYYHEIERTVMNIIHELMEIPILRKFIEWVESWFNQVVEADQFKLWSRTAGKITGVYLGESVAWLRLYIPMLTSVPTLPTVLPNLNAHVPSHMWKYVKEPSSIVEYAIHPYASTARLEEERLTTFDGLVVPFIPSKCQLLLAEVYGDKIKIVRPNPRRSDVKIQLRSGEEIELILSEDKAPEVPVLRRFNTARLPRANITKNSEEVTVRMEGMVLKARRNDIEVKAKPWAFSKVEGIMGNHDNEMSNDVPQETLVTYHPHSFGPKHHVSRKWAWQLLEKYRSNRSCRIPRA